MQQALPNVLPDFGSASLLVIGDVMLDRYWFGEASRISPEAPVPIVRIHENNDRPGGAGNVALSITALGAKAKLLSITGQDHSAKLLTEQLKIALVEPDFCELNSLSTTIKLRVISQRQQLIRLDFEEINASHYHPDLLERYKNHLAAVDLVILSDYKKGTLSDPQSLIRLARAAGKPVLVDPKGTDFSIYRHAHIITPNMKEFEAVMGVSPDEETILVKGRALLGQYEIDTLLLTRGEHGMTLIDKSECLHFPAYAREVADVTGAGDTVIAVLGASIAAGLEIKTAAALANLAASLAVAKLGAVNVSAPELQAAIAGKTILSSGIVNDNQLLQAVVAARSAGKKIVFTNGCFDILHAAHVTYLELAKKCGDYLIVAVNDDESIQKLKGPYRPINHLEHRMKVLASLGVVDWVVAFSDDTPERLLNLIKPDVLAKGNDYTIDQVVGADLVRAYGGEIKILESNNTAAVVSSSSIIKKIQTSSREYHG